MTKHKKKRVWSPGALAQLRERTLKQNSDPAFIARRAAGIAAYQLKLKSPSSPASSTQIPPMSEPAAKPVPTPAELLKLVQDMPPKGAPTLRLLPDPAPESADSQDAEAITIEPAEATPTAPEAPTEPAPDAGPPIINVNEQKRTRIKWNDAEIALVAVKVAELAAKQGWRMVPEEGDRVGRALLHDMICTAQLLLERDRRRTSAPIHAYGDHVWAAVNKALAEKSYVKPEPVPVVVLPPGATDATLPKTYQPARTTPAPSAPSAPAAQSVAELPTAALLAETFSRLLGLVSTQEAQARKFSELEAAHAKREADLMQRMAELENRIATRAPTEEKHRLPLVAVLGCDDQMMGLLRNAATKAGVKVDFRHYNHDSNPRPVHADRVLTFKFVDHRWYDQIKATFPDKTNRRFIPGGIGMAIQVLQEWFPAAS